MAPHLGKEVFFGIRPEDIFDPKYAPPDITEDSNLAAQVDVTELLGSEIYLYLLVGKHTPIARVDPRTASKTGDEITLLMDMNKMHVFDRQSQEAYL